MKNKEPEETICWQIIKSEYKNQAWVKKLIGLAYDEGFEDMKNKIIGIYAELMSKAHAEQKVVGEKNDYYVTLYELEEKLKNEN